MCNSFSCLDAFLTLVFLYSNRFAVSEDCLQTSQDLRKHDITPDDTIPDDIIPNDIKSNDIIPDDSKLNINGEADDVEGDDDDDKEGSCSTELNTTSIDHNQKPPYRAGRRVTVK